MSLAEVIDEHFLARYRALLDAEDVAFDELEHAYEEGDRDHWEADLSAWKAAHRRRIEYLARRNVRNLPGVIADLSKRLAHLTAEAASHSARRP